MSSVAWNLEVISEGVMVVLKNVGTGTKTPGGGSDALEVITLTRLPFT